MSLKLGYILFGVVAIAVASSHSDTILSCSSGSDLSDVSCFSETKNIPNKSLHLILNNKIDITESITLIGDSSYLNIINDLIATDRDTSSLPGLSNYTGFLDRSFSDSVDHVNEYDNSDSLLLNITTNHNSPLFYDSHLEQCGSFM